MVDYQHVRVDDLPDAPSPTDHKKEVDEALGATEFGLNVFVGRPGQRLPWGYHRHPEHEEAFYVVEGRVLFETPEGEVAVDAGEALFVPRDAPQRGRIVGDAPARVVALGAPKATDGAIISEACPACGEMTGRNHEVVAEGGDPAIVLTCDACGAETDRLRSGPDP